MTLNSPDIILIQEHWLTPDNMYRFEQDITSHFAFVKSAMSHCVAHGPLVGRPYGGALILIKNELRGVTTCVYCADRYVIVRVGNLLVVNVYLPCAGTDNRLNIIEDILYDVWSWRLQSPECVLCIGYGWRL